ncbi:methyl-accepting chemotaxis protein [Delftia sp. PS-11]|uniref:methyl-accepting chemotaxis protein n=1 Tax=Delftia sp. PS-11 TaxID=2767222 RepID=UPI0024565FD9|nr:methyl-accepting chemotaxis protein [Delftia sp. PS-11]KAJ8738159.1 MCP four helix bundle domain-containing protein [Delftia sp. PS-11]
MSPERSSPMKVSTRLTFGFGILLAGMLLVSSIAMLRFSLLERHLDQLIGNRMTKVAQFSELKDKLQSVARITRTVALIEDAKDAQSQADRITPLRARIQELIAQLGKTVVQPKGIELLKIVQDNLPAYDRDMDTAIKLGMTGKPEDAKAATEILLGKVGPRQEVIFKAMDDSMARQQELAQAAGDEAHAALASARFLIIAVTTISLLLGILIALAIARSITRALGAEPHEVSQVVGRVAAGDLSQHVALRPGDHSSVMAGVQRMQASLVKVVGTVRQSSEAVAAASSQIASGNRDLSSRTEEQASALQQTAASMEELSSTVAHSSDNASQANQLAQTAAGVASQGGAVVAEVVGTMKEISDSSHKITDIIGVIDGIAFQTNILALNAAVEAARAGEQGRGFAVVAGEVRVLAGRSAEAAREIRRLIQESVQRVEAGSALVDRAGDTMGEVVASIQRVSTLMSAISAESSEQSRGVSQIGEAVHQIDQTTQQNAALVEEMSAAADSLRAQANELVQAVAVFQLGQGAAGASAIPAPTAPRLAPSALKAREDAKTPARTAQALQRPVAQTEAARPKALARPARQSAATASAGGQDEWESF